MTTSPACVACAENCTLIPNRPAGEERTAARVREFLTTCGPAEVLAGLGGGHGFAAVFAGSAPAAGPTVVLRAELDALPIQETGTPAHRSTRDGVAHLCGHDGHLAILCGAGLALLRGATGARPRGAARATRRGDRRGCAGHRRRSALPGARPRLDLRAAQSAGTPAGRGAGARRAVHRRQRRVRRATHRPDGARGLSGAGRQPGARDGRPRVRPRHPAHSPGGARRAGAGDRRPRASRRRRVRHQPRRSRGHGDLASGAARGAGRVARGGCGPGPRDGGARPARPGPGLGRGIPARRQPPRRRADRREGRAPARACASPPPPRIPFAGRKISAGSCGRPRARSSGSARAGTSRPCMPGTTTFPIA